MLSVIEEQLRVRLGHLINEPFKELTIDVANIQVVAIIFFRHVLS